MLIRRSVCALALELAFILASRQLGLITLPSFTLESIMPLVVLPGWHYP
jgi:hypothetical protein